MTANNAQPASTSVQPTTAKRTPTFLIIGVQKSGTTSIYNYLKQHPQVYMSPVKETGFFERDWEQEPADVQRRKKNGIVAWHQYQQLFASATGEHLALGEASPNYLFHYRSSAEQIKRRLPTAKLIAILRNPVQRACSDYLMNRRDAVGKQTPLAEQVRSRGDSSYVLLKGKYYEQLKHFIDMFGRSQVDVFLYDDLRHDSQSFMTAMYQSIGVSSDFVANTAKKAQTAKVPKNQTLNRLLKTQNPIRTAATGLMQIVPADLRHHLRERLISLNSQDKSQATFTEEDLILLRQYYREDILKLQDLLQRDLSAWLDAD
ncbi:sulfotransferase [Leptolyngbya cf. ectocarpi LEGE 11479]|uniref:Sulfotransferase n=1 Tax=Leptolyngbya cf. ectocarpi LEGE 11479 TaxID=1828722 RepID=A0A929F607_LEPEC|nr:sulfotransferase [Leptolyngbya ectocarpi]MBE9067910.1 sulfotransferase [Leptolyngbya cf. ectocarpi LEGE 11479]